MPKRKSYSGRWTTNNNKRRRGYRSGWKRSVMRRTRAGRMNRFPTYKFRRYITSIATSYAANVWSEGNLPFDMYPSSTVQTEWGITYAFTISDIATSSEFKNLFDRYMLVGVRLKYYLSENPNSDVNRTNQLGTLNSAIYPRMWYCIDNDDANVETLAQLKQRAGTKCRVLQPNKPVSIYIPFPRSSSSVQILGSAVQSAMVNRPNWFDWSADTVSHYGLKCVFDLDGLSASSAAPQTSTGHGSPFRIRMEGQYYFKCKDVR